MKKILPIIIAALTFAGGVKAQKTLFDSSKGIFGYRKSYYRIPAILNQGGKLRAFTDDRTNATGDIGNGNIKIIAKTRTANGSTWDSDATIIADYNSSATSGFDYAHGDAAVVCDRGNSNNMLMMCASGSIGYWDSKASAPIRVGKYISTDGGSKWTVTDVTNNIYGIWSSSTTNSITGLFFSSGRICQSRLVKHGTYYRLYSAVVTNEGSLVVYSDDFGHTWVPLGGADARPAPQGDEAKIEELPDGRVLLSCRRSGQDGRWFNIFTYADRQCQDGSWAEPVASEKHDGGTATINNNCNGEILFIPALDADGRKVYVALQSVPRGTPGNHPTNLERRSHVSIYWKAFDTADSWATPDSWAEGWQRHEITDGYSAYSSMALDGNGDICFIYEDHGVHFRLGSQPTEMYDILYRHLSLQDITGGRYQYRAAK